jgi:hypothetical protein
MWNMTFSSRRKSVLSTPSKRRGSFCWIRPTVRHSKRVTGTCPRIDCFVLFIGQIIDIVMGGCRPPVSTCHFLVSQFLRIFSERPCRVSVKNHGSPKDTLFCIRITSDVGRGVFCTRIRISSLTMTLLRPLWTLRGREQILSRANCPGDYVYFG